MLRIPNFILLLFTVFLLHIWRYQQRRTFSRNRKYSFGLCMMHVVFFWCQTTIFFMIVCAWCWDFLLSDFEPGLFCYECWECFSKILVSREFVAARSNWYFVIFKELSFVFGKCFFGIEWMSLEDWVLWRGVNRTRKVLDFVEPDWSWAEELVLFISWLGFAIDFVVAWSRIVVQFKLHPFLGSAVLIHFA